MPEGDLVQRGTLVEVAIGNMAFGKGVIQGVTGPTRMADINAVRDERDATVTKFYTDPARTIEVVLVIKDDGSHTELGVLEGLKPGDCVTLNTGGTFAARTDEDWLIEEPPRIERGSRETRYTYVCKREDAMGAAIDAIATPTDMTA